MIRVGLIAYLMVATMAGPAWCCCTIGRAVSLAIPTASQGSKTNHSCCCPRESETKEHSQDEGETCPTEKENCPCKKAAEFQSAKLAVEISQVVYETSALQGSAADVAFGSAVLSRLHLQGHMPDFSAPGALSGRGILSAFRVFRC